MGVNSANGEQMLIYVGSYADGDSDGLYVFQLDTNTGKLNLLHSYAGIANPSFLTFDKRKRYLYSVGETIEFKGQPGGSVFSFKMDEATGKLTMLNEQRTIGGAPCHVALDRTEKLLFAANYLGGDFCMWPIEDDGQIGELAVRIEHSGTGPNADRQEGAHTHSVIVDHNNRFVFVPDLGIDQIVVYRLDATSHKLSLHDEVRVAPGAGPRHFVFHPNGKLAYLINELDSTIVAFTYDAEAGKLSALQTVSTLPADFQGQNDCADIHVSPSGRFLYGSNRGHDSIVVFEIDPNIGTLTFVEHVSTLGETPRNFAITPDGKFLLAANQDTDTIVTFSIDLNNGKCTPTGHVISVAKPVCIKM